MVRVDSVWELLNFITNKDQQGNTVSIPEFNIICKAVNVDFFKQRYGLPKQYQAGQPLPQMSYEITQKITDDLKAFKVRMGYDTSAMIIDTQGRASIPSDYVHFSSATYNLIADNSCGTVTARQRQIEHLTDAQVNDRLSNSIKMPTKRNPIFTTYSTYFQFYPKNLRYVDFTYLRMPRTPFYNSEPDEETDLEIFVENGSVHFEYPEDCFTDIVMLCLSYVGVNMQSADIVQYAELIKEKGV